MNIRKLVSVLMALVLVLACSSFAVAEERTEVVIWHTFTNDQEAMLQTLADEFNASQDSYTVLVQSQPYSGFENNVLSAVSNGVGPDMIIYYASTVSNYIDAGLVADLGKYVYDAECGIEGFNEALPEAILAEASSFSNATMHCIPLTTSGPILFYNKDLYAQAGVEIPTTWDELYAVAQKIYDETGVSGCANDSQTDSMQALVFASGSEYINMDTLTVGWNNEAFAEKLQKYADANLSGAIAATASGDYWSSDFNAGVVASYIGSCAGVPYIQPDGFEYDVAPMVLDETNPWYPAWNRAAICFSTTEEKERATYEFIKFFVQPANNARWCEACEYLSPYAWTAEDAGYAEFVANSPALTAVQANLQKAGYLPNVFGASTVRSELQKAATMACAGAMTAAEAIAEAAANCDAELANGK